jgi:hypothetical protein
MKQRFLKAFDIALVVTVLVIAAWGIRGYVSQKNINDSYRAGVASGLRISVDYGTGTPVAGDIVASGTVLDAIKAFAAQNNLALETKTYPGMGTLVTRIGESKNGASGAYWQYWINGVYATSSADNAAVHPGARSEWKFSDSAQ